MSRIIPGGAAIKHPSNCRSGRVGKRLGDKLSSQIGNFDRLRGAVHPISDHDDIVRRRLAPTPASRRALLNTT